MRARSIRSALAFGALVAAALGPAPGLAGQEPTARAYLTPGTTVGVGSAFVLNLEITGANSVDRDPIVPDLGAFAQYLGSGRSTSMQMVGGRTTVSLTVQYRFQALREGTFDIGPVTVRVGGRDLRTDPLQLTVSSAAPAAGQQGGTDASGIAPEDLFITAQASRRRVLVGEPLTIEYRIWTRLDVGQYTLTRVPEPEGFWVEDLEEITQPEVEQRDRDGRPYATAVIRRIALIPARPGERTLEPLGVEAQVRVRRSRDPFESLLGRSSLFGTTVVPATVLSNRLTIDVQSLPPGRPEPFSGVVGALSLSASLDRDTVDANDAVTLTLRVTGRGNVQAIPEPALELPRDFEAFPPEVSESMRPSGSGLSGTKTFEYVLIPRAPGDRIIPSVSMGYYDTDAGAYRTVTTGDIPLTVTGVVAEGPAELTRAGVTQLREDIRFIHLGAVAFRPTGRRLADSAAFWALFLLPMVAVLGALGLRRHWDRLEDDVAYARGRRAGRVAKKRLAEARRLADTEDARSFYAEAARALRGFVADKLNVPEAGMQIADLAARLGAQGVARATVDELRECLEHCDRQRFSPPSADTGERARFLERVAGVMGALNKEVR